jgi:hypothetical protein
MDPTVSRPRGEPEARFCAWRRAAWPPRQRPAAAPESKAPFLSAKPTQATSPAVPLTPPPPTPLPAQLQAPAAWTLKVAILLQMKRSEAADFLQSQQLLAACGVELPRSLLESTMVLAAAVAGELPTLHLVLGAVPGAGERAARAGARLRAAWGRRPRRRAAAAAAAGPRPARPAAAAARGRARCSEAGRGLRAARCSRR